MTDRVPEDLLENLSPEERAEREGLLRWLLERDVEVEDLREASREGRLALVPTEVVLTRDCRYSLDDAASRTGLSTEFIARAWRSAGIAIPESDEPMLDDEDMEAIEMAKQVLDAGLSEEAYLDITRVVGRGSTPTAEALVQISVGHFLESADSEGAFAMQLEEIAEQLAPLLPTLLAFPVRMHLRDAIRHQALEQSGRGVEALSGTRELAIGFADLVGFTALSERLTLAESGGIAARLEDLAGSAAEPPVRLVKLIGDAAMLVSDDSTALVRALCDLAESASAAEDFPDLRMGAADGEVAARAGDVYGPAVNLASRLADLAEPGQLLAAPDLAKQLSDEFEIREQSVQEVKGIGEIRPAEVVVPDAAGGS
jgi:adenylate cyclase